MFDHSHHHIERLHSCCCCWTNPGSIVLGIHVARNLEKYWMDGSSFSMMLMMLYSYSPWCGVGSDSRAVVPFVRSYLVKNDFYMKGMCSTVRVSLNFHNTRLSDIAFPRSSVLYKLPPPSTPLRKASLLHGLTVRECLGSSTIPDLAPTNFSQ